MDDQWFLDLDGVRSGPYHTNEVLSLIAEGEVLPHHRIARGLKDLEWMTILDWRLDRAKIPHSAMPAPTPESPAPVKTPKPAPEATAAPISPVPSESKTAPSRDPMAEMFDTLQTAKQKREARQLQHAQQASAENAATGADRTPSPATIAMICAGLAVAGIAIGQWYRSVSGPKEAETTTPSSASEPSPVPESSPTATPEPETEVVEHSTEKVTIRAVVEKRPEIQRPPTPEPTPEPTPTPEESQASGDDKKGAADKELEELRDLKKELKELKALKEQLRDGVQEDGFGDGPPAPQRNPDPAPANPTPY